MWGVRPSEILKSNLIDFHVDMAMGVAALAAKDSEGASLPKDIWGDVVKAMIKGVRLGR
jgi:hypothetical protein